VDRELCRDPVGNRGLGTSALTPCQQSEAGGQESYDQPPCEVFQKIILMMTRFAVDLDVIWTSRQAGVSASMATRHDVEQQV
jgi:hypothetical protein